MRNQYIQDCLTSMLNWCEEYRDELEDVKDYVETLEKQVEKYKERAERYEGLYRG